MYREYIEDFYRSKNFSVKTFPISGNLLNSVFHVTYFTVKKVKNYLPILIANHFPQIIIQINKDAKLKQVNRQTNKTNKKMKAKIKKQNQNIVSLNFHFG